MRVRILAGEIGPEWKVILEEILRSDDELELVSVEDNAVDLLVRAREARADVVVLRQVPGGHEPGVSTHLLLEYPNLAVVLLPDRLESGSLVRLVLRDERWNDASRESLRSALHHHRWK